MPKKKRSLVASVPSQLMSAYRCPRKKEVWWQVFHQLMSAYRYLRKNKVWWQVFHHSRCGLPMPKKKRSLMASVPSQLRWAYRCSRKKKKSDGKCSITTEVSLPIPKIKSDGKCSITADAAYRCLRKNSRSRTPIDRQEGSEQQGQCDAAPENKEICYLWAVCEGWMGGKCLLNRWQEIG